VPTPVKITVIGAGSATFSLGLVKDLCLTENLHGSHVSFMDIDPSRLDMIHRLAQRYSDELGAGLTFDKTTDREASLQDATFVISTVYAKGHYHARRMRELTAKHGYYYGGVGLGSYYDFSVMMGVVRDMERICPDAWLIQSGNPVFDGTTLMTRESSIKVIGLCHGHYGYTRICRELGLDLKKVTYEAPGLNHNIWMTTFLYEGQDAYPLIDQWIETKGPEYWRTHQADGTHDTQLSKGTIHQYRMFGLMPIGDTPRRGGWWYHTDIETKKRWFGEPYGGPDTEIARPVHVENLEKRLAQIARVAADPAARVSKEFGTTRTREQQVPIIDALTNNVEGRFQVNVPNQGALDGVADDVAVEVQALIDKAGVHRIKAKPLPKKIMLTQILPNVLGMERGLEAFKTGDRALLLWGVLESHQTRSYDQGVAVFKDLMAMDGHDELNEYFAGPRVEDF
jgi:alpha-galactosidase